MKYFINQDYHCSSVAGLLVEAVASLDLSRPVWTLSSAPN